MPRTIIESQRTNEIIRKKSFLLFEIDIGKRETFTLSVQHPDGKIELENYYVVEYIDGRKPKVIVSGSLSSKTQEVVNRFEAQGYFVPTSQFALFIKGRTNVLILEKR